MKVPNVSATKLHELNNICTFLWVTQTAESTPFTATEVRPAWLMALKAYSTWYRRPSGEKIVMWRSKPALLPLDIFGGYCRSYGGKEQKTKR